MFHLLLYSAYPWEDTQTWDPTTNLIPELSNCIASTNLTQRSVAAKASSGSTSVYQEHYDDDEKTTKDNGIAIQSS